MTRLELESKLRVLVDHAWDADINWPQVENWLINFQGDVRSSREEQLYALFLLSRFMYFSKRMLRQMLYSLYEEHFKAPLMQRIRRNYKNTKDVTFLNKVYAQELACTRFVGVGNPAESGAHLLYYFRQVNYLPKNLFVDIAAAFTPVSNLKSTRVSYVQRDSSVTRYVFFDDLVGSGDQVSLYLTDQLSKIKRDNSNLDLRFMALFATTQGLERLSQSTLFNDRVACLFELDSTYKAFDINSRYFSSSPDWFDKDILKEICMAYGNHLKPKDPLGYRDSQLLMGFSHNTPDNSLPVFWDEGYLVPWNPIFIRYDKKY